MMKIRPLMNRGRKRFRYHWLKPDGKAHFSATTSAHTEELAQEMWHAVEEQIVEASTLYKGTKAAHATAIEQRDEARKELDASDRRAIRLQDELNGSEKNLKTMTAARDKLMEDLGDVSRRREEADQDLATAMDERNVARARNTELETALADATRERDDARSRVRDLESSRLRRWFGRRS